MHIGDILDGEVYFLRAAAAGWGSEGSNGGQVNLNTSKQTISGNMLVDDVSVLNLYLKPSTARSTVTVRQAMCMSNSAAAPSGL